MTGIFSGKRVLVTGHTGFKGSWLTLWLKLLGADVTGVALDPEDDNGAFHAMRIASLCNDIRQDINDSDAVQRIFSSCRPEVVFHLAAQALVMEGYRHPVDTFRTNILGTVNVLEACRRTDTVSAIVVVTSDKCYEEAVSVSGYAETDRLGGRDPYSASKASAELVVRSYRDSFLSAAGPAGLASARAGNVIGGGDTAANRIVPDCIRALIAGNPVEVRNPAAVRPWQHVLDPLGGYLLLAAQLMQQPTACAEAWNFGPGQQGNKTVEELVKAVIDAWGSGQYVMAPAPEQPYEAKLLMLNIDKAAARLGWHPVFNFKEAVGLTVDWYRLQSNGADMQHTAIQQIENYRKKQR